MSEPFVGDGRVAGNLAVEDALDVIEVGRHGEIVDVLDGQAVIVGRAGGLDGAEVFRERRDTVFCDVHDIRVLVGETDAGCVAVCAHIDRDVEHMVGLRSLDVDGGLFEIAAERRHLRGRGMRDDFEARVRVAEERARCRRDLDALAAFRVRHDDALDVLDDVAGRRDRDGFRQRPEHLARLCRRERDGDRLRAAHRRHELAAEDFEIRGVERVRFFHGERPFKKGAATCHACENIV